MKLRFAAPADAGRHQRHRRASTCSPRRTGRCASARSSATRPASGPSCSAGASGVLGDAAPQISDPLVRNRGTVAGSLAHADPQGDWASALLAAAARAWSRAARAASARDRRRRPAGRAVHDDARAERADHRGAGARPRPARGRHLPEARAQGRRLRHRRRGGARRRSTTATSGAPASRSPRSGRATCGPARPRTRWRAAALDDEAIEEAARLAAEAAEPRDDSRGSAEYKRNVVRVFVAARAAPRHGRGVSMVRDASVNGRDREHRGGRAAHAAGALPARDARPDRHAHRLRHDRAAAPARCCSTASRSSRARCFAVQADGREVTTVEGLETTAGLHPIQEGFHEEHGLQCGFCTPGMMLDDGRPARGEPGPERGGDPLGAVRQRLPLHRLPEHRQGGAVTRRPLDRGEA